MTEAARCPAFFSQALVMLFELGFVTPQHLLDRTVSARQGMRARLSGDTSNPSL